MKAERVGLESAGDLSPPRCVAVWRVCIHPCMPALSDRVTRRKRERRVSECACVLVGSGATYVVCARVSKRTRTVLPVKCQPPPISQRNGERESAAGARRGPEAGPRMRRTRRATVRSGRPLCTDITTSNSLDIMHHLSNLSYHEPEITRHEVRTRP